MVNLLHSFSGRSQELHSFRLNEISQRRPEVSLQIYDQGVLLEEQLIPEREARTVAEHYERRGYEVRVDAA